MPGDRRTAFAVALIAVTLSACGSPATPEPPRDAPIVQRSHTTMGSPLEITIVTEARDIADSVMMKAFAEVDRLDAMMSVWKPGSELLALNQAAGERPVKVSPEMIEVLTEARQAGDWTEGKFDVTFGAFSGLWKFDAQNQDNSIPTRGDIERRLPLLDYTQVEVDAAAGTAFLKRKGFSAHLGGIGKGYAVDRAASILRAAGFRDFMIQFGGDLLFSGRRSDRPWRAAIRDPRGPVERVIAAIDLSDETFSTSGDYERYFLAGGRRYHHIIDPDTGEPARGSRSVTIVARRGVVADALSTGVFVMGPDKGMALIERLPDVEGVIVNDQNQILISSGLKNRLTLLQEPTDAP